MGEAAVLTGLRIPSFRWLWTGQLLSQFGNSVFLVMALWEIQLKSPVLLSVAGMAMMLPQVLAAVGGIVVDRFDARQLMLWTDVLRGGAVALGLLLLLVSPASQPWIIIALLAVNSLGNALFSPAESVLIPTLVPDRDLASANGLYSLTFQLSSAVGSAIGGAAIAVVGVTLVFGFDLGSFWFSALAILLMIRITGRSHGPIAEQAPVQHEERVGFRAGWQALVGFRWFVVLLPLVVLSNFTGNGAFIVLPYWIHHHLHASVTWYGLTEGAWATGTVLGSLSAGFWSRYSARRVVGIAGIFQAVMWGAFALSHGTATAAATFLAAGVANGVVNALLFTMLQRAIPAAVRGRAFGLLVSLLAAANPLAALLSGLSLGVVPVVLWYVSGAVTGGLLGVFLWIMIPADAADDAIAEGAIQRS